MKQILIIVAIALLIPVCGCERPVEQRDVQQSKSNDKTKLNSGSTNSGSGSLDSNALPVKTSERERNEIEYGDKFPQVLAVEFAAIKNENWQFKVTLSSAYDSPQRYADAWRVLDDQDNELGIRILGHDHASEQPFTRSGNIEVPKDVSVVFVEGRDQKNGWSGQRFKVDLK